MIVSTPALDLMDAWHDSDPDHKRVHVNFPINTFTGTADTAVVYFELEPGERLGTHTDSAEEVLYIVSGAGEASVGDDTARVREGDLVVIPAMAPHGAHNDGEETLKVVGFFSASTIVSTFVEPLQPAGKHRLLMGGEG